MNQLKSLSAILLISMMGVGLATVIPLAFVLYSTMQQAEQDKLIQISNAALKPIANLAVRSVNGANKMKLRNKDALGLYESAGLLYLHIKGMSKASAATAFAAAQPPREIEYTYRLDKSDKRIELILKQTDEQFLDENNFVLLLNQDLSSIENGGKVTAVFSAKAMQGLRLKILQQMAIPIISILLFVMLVATFLGRWISKPIAETSQQISEISHSLNLHMQVSTSTPINEINNIVITFNHFLKKVEEIITRLNKMIIHMQDASQTLTEITANTKQRINQQEVQTDQVATAVEQMTAATHMVTENANHAAESAQQANQEAQTGASTVNETVSAITQLSAQIETATDAIKRVEGDSNNIGSVLDVIRGIAEQTNLLALNAAIEAARAGESGRGFAVVADEVRTLASRTQESTEEIAKMVETLQTGTEQASSAIEIARGQTGKSVEKANTAGQSLQTITHSVDTISEMNSQIAISAKEQSDVAHTVSESITQIAMLTEQTSEDSSTSSEASEKLAQLANELKGLSEQFKVN